MLQLHPDINFHYETMRALGTIPYGSTDFSEVSEIMAKIKVGDFDSWYDEWFGLAQRVLATVDENNESNYSPVTLRNVYFRASHYIFVADFFLHGNKQDPRAKQAYKLWRKYFDKASALMDIPGKHVTIESRDGDFSMPSIFFRAKEATPSTPRPTIIVGGGFESNMEETFHVFGVAALRRGYNVIIYEGPGHRTLIETQGKGFIPDWERAVSPIVDYIFANNAAETAYIDTSKIGLIGMSLGGYLAARAAAFEPRLAAVMCIDGVWSFLDCSMNIVGGEEIRSAFHSGNKETFDALFNAEPEKWNSGRRWFHDDLLFTFHQDSPYEAYKIAEKMTLAGGVAERIRCPAYIGDAQDDLFFEGQPPQVVEGIKRGGNNDVVIRKFGEEGLGAQLHCQSGALVYLNGDMLEWFGGVVGR